MDNKIIEKYFSTNGIDPELPRILEEISHETGFVIEQEIQRRWIYDPAKTWRVRVRGMFQKKKVILQITALQLETDEEAVRSMFRAQAEHARVRPPHCFTSKAFDAARGYAYDIEEDVSEKILFDPAGSPDDAVAAFVPFYRELRTAVTSPFWLADQSNEMVQTFSVDQANAWMKLARERNLEDVARVESVVDQLAKKMHTTLKEGKTRFMHAHLSGWDVRVVEDGGWVVLANHFWSWRQPGYDIAFPLWGQWMALPFEKRTPENVAAITEVWLKAVRDQLSDLVDESDVRVMLLNRLYGSLLLDIPAKKSHEPLEAVEALERACIAEAERLLI